ncbi:MAG TPA: hypothetical protein VGR37_13150 [Longimicrobiaceae bacterium]|nr:hypothetical protein [Longimicrobiaceae bacterium]
MATLTARIDDWLDEEVREFWKALGEGPSSGFRHVVEEWWTLQNLPGLEFRDGVSGRRAGIRNGPDVWEVVMVARDYDGDLDALDGHFGGLLPREALGQALEYAGRFPAEVDRRIEENLRIERLLGGSRR